MELEIGDTFGALPLVLRGIFVLTVPTERRHVHRSPGHHVHLWDHNNAGVSFGILQCGPRSFGVLIQVPDVFLFHVLSKRWAFVETFGAFAG